MELSANIGPIQFIGSGADAVTHTLLLELGVQAWYTAYLVPNHFIFLFPNFGIEGVFQS